jgi:hypothetical protein
MAAAVSVRADYDAAQLREQAKQSADAPIRPGACCRWSEKCPEETRELVAKALNELCIFSRFSLNARDIAEVLLSYTFVILAKTSGSFGLIFGIGRGLSSRAVEIAEWMP